MRTNDYVSLKDKYNLKFDYIIFKDGKIINKFNNKEIKPYVDPRRPEQCSIIYLKKNDNKRLCIYHDQLMCESFIKNFNNSSPIIHKDGDIFNCSLNNLYVDDGINVLKNHYNETKEWKEIKLNNIKLFYRYFICEDGRLYNASTDSFVKPFIDNRNDDNHYGYLRYNLYIGKNITDIIHIAAARLVAEYFIPKQNKSYDVVIYKDGDYSNIDKSNLYWGDRYDAVMKNKENISRKFEKLSDPIYGKEKWKPMKYFTLKFNDEYLISSFGRVYNKTKKFYVTQGSGSTNNFNQSYKYCMINIKNVGFKNISVHRLVAYNFCLNYDYSIYTCVNHINGNPSFNYAINLEWCTPYENIHHAIETNLIHNKNFHTDYKSKEMKFIIFIAWMYATIDNIDDTIAYEFYKKYSLAYNNMTICKIDSLDTFTLLVKKYSNNTDYKKLYNFYKNYNQKI